MLLEVPPAFEDESQVLYRLPDADVNPSHCYTGLRTWLIPTTRKTQSLGLKQRDFKSQLPDSVYDNRSRC